LSIGQALPQKDEPRGAELEEYVAEIQLPEQVKLPTRSTKQQNARNQHSRPAGWPERQTPTTQVTRTQIFKTTNTMKQLKFPE
jgi:hypothetical protein